MNSENILRNFGLMVVVVASLGVTGCSKQSRMERSLAKADEFMQAGNLAAAEIEYLNALRIESRQPEAICALGTIYHDQGRWSSATPFLVEGVRLAPERLDLRLCVSGLYLGAGHNEEARTHAEFILGEQPTNAEAVLILAEASDTPEEIEATRQRVGLLRQQTGDQAVFHVAEASFLAFEEDYEGAEIEAIRAVEMAPHFDAGYVVLGTVLLQLGREDDARKAFEDSYALASPRSLRKMLWIEYLFSHGEYDQARALLLKLNEETPDRLPPQLYLANIALRMEDFDDSEQWLRKTLAIDRRNPEALSLLAQLRIEQGRTEEGLLVLEGLVRALPDSAQLRLKLAEAHIREGELGAALAILKQAADLSPEIVAPRLASAEISLRLGDTDGALVTLNDLLAQNPNDRRVQFLLGDAHRKGGNLDEAAVCYLSLIESNPLDHEARFRYGLVLLLSGQTSEARLVFEEVLETAPGHLPTLAALADMDLGNEDLSASLDRIREQARLNPEAMGPHLLLAQIHLAQGSTTAAEAELKTLIGLTPSWSPPYIALTRLYLKNDRSSEARSQLDALLENQPDDVQALLMLALMDESQGDVSAAARSYEAILSVQSKNVVALNNLAYIYTESLSDPDRAMELAAQAYELAPRDPSVGDTFGWVLFKRGEYRRALGLLRESADQLGAHPQPHYHSGVAAYMNGREELAREHLEEALRLGLKDEDREEANWHLAVISVSQESADPQSVDLLEQALKRRAADPVALARFAAVCEQREDYQRLREVYEAGLKANPDSVSVLIGLAETLSQYFNDPERALELARAARVLAPQDPVVAYALGTLAFRSGDYGWAVSLLEESMAGQRPELKLSYDLAMAYYALGRLSDAQRTLSQAPIDKLASLEAARVQHFIEMLDLQQHMGDPQQARQAAEEVLQEQPNSVSARMVLGLAAEQQGEFELAKQSFETVLQSYPQFLPAMKWLAILAADHLGDDALAYSYGIQAREQLPTDAELARSLGRVMYRKGDFQDAADLLRQGLDEYPDDADVLYHLGLAQLEISQLSASRQALLKALELEPDHRLALAARQALE